MKKKVLKAIYSPIIDADIKVAKRKIKSGGDLTGAEVASVQTAISILLKEKLGIECFGVGSSKVFLYILQALEQGSRK